MTPRGGGILGSVVFVLLLAFGSYLLDVPMPTVLIGAAFAILVILWVGTRDAARNSAASRSFSAKSDGESPVPPLGASPPGATPPLAKANAEPLAQPSAPKPPADPGR